MNSELPKDFDLGLERIPLELRAYCWEICKKDDNNPWNTFKDAVMQIHYGGVSSEAEALRLFCAEQIRTKTFFFDDLAPALLAEKLSEEIQTSFQNNARPISTESNPEKQTVEILHYYFPDDSSLKNFELALSGQMNDLQALAEEELIQATIHNTQSTLSIPEDQVSLNKLSRLSEKINAANQNSTKPFQTQEIDSIQSPIKNKETPNPRTANIKDMPERPKIKAYLESLTSGNDSGVDLPNRIKEILARYYSELMGK